MDASQALESWTSPAVEFCLKTGSPLPASKWSPEEQLLKWDTLVRRFRLMPEQGRALAVVLERESLLLTQTLHSVTMTGFTPEFEAFAIEKQDWLMIPAPVGCCVMEHLPLKPGDSVSFGAYVRHYFPTICRRFCDMLGVTRD